MSTRPLRLPQLLLILLPVATIVGACQLLGEGDLYPRTFPGASDYPLKSIVEVYGLPVGATTVNVNGYVSSVTVCPDYADCVAPNSISVVESLVNDLPQHGILLELDEPRQFKLHRRYLFSLEAHVDSLNDDVVRSFTLLGYDRL